MQVSKKKVNQILEKQVKGMMWQLISDIKNPEEAEKIMGGILTDTELSAITKRLAVGYWLKKNRSYEVIKENLKVSSATIATVQQDLKKPGWKAAILKIEAEEWATKWEAKINNLFKIKK
jgi:uncharacterized protein YerC